MREIVLPKLGYATEQGTVLAWLKAEGDALRAGEELAEVAMEKTVHVIAAPEAGVLLKIAAPVGAIVPEGEPIAWSGRDGERPPQRRCRIVGWEPALAPPPADLEQWLRESQPPGGPEPAAPASAPLRRFETRHREFLRGQLRPLTAQRMARSWVDAPKVDLFADVDFSEVAAHRQALKQQGTEAPSYNVYIAHAVVKAFQDLPEYNFQCVGGETVPLDGIHVGLAVALGDNLVTVSMKNLQGAGLMEIQQRFKTLIRKALRVSLSREELYGSSLTITNLGEFEVTAFTAVLNPPELFILAIGALEERPVVRDGQVVAAPMCTFCLSFDHRGVDGAPASRLLQQIKHHLEHYEDEG